MNIISKLLTDAIIRMLRVLGKLGAKYPDKLKQAQREEFKKKIQEYNKGQTNDNHNMDK